MEKKGEGESVKSRISKELVRSEYPYIDKCSKRGKNQQNDGIWNMRISAATKILQVTDSLTLGQTDPWH